jgi:excisionase family DNA binding protein
MNCSIEKKGENQMLQESQKLLTVDQLAEKLQVKKGWVYGQLRKKGPKGIPHYKAGKYRRFQWDKVLAWMESQV